MFNYEDKVKQKALVKNLKIYIDSKSIENSVSRYDILSNN